jgi:hypothetical protein
VVRLPQAALNLENEMKTIKKSKAKRLLPGLLNRYRRRLEKLAMLRKQHPDRLPEAKRAEALKKARLSRKKARKAAQKVATKAHNAYLAAQLAEAVVETEQAAA